MTSCMLVLKALQSWHGSRQIFASAQAFSCIQLPIVWFPFVLAIDYHRRSSSTLYSNRPCDNDCHVVRLLGATEPVCHRVDDHVAYTGERRVSVLLDQFDHAFLAEFALIVLRLGDAIAECDQNIAGEHRDRRFLIGCTIK